MSHPSTFINPMQANTIRILFNTVAIFAMEIDYNVKPCQDGIIFNLWADGRNLFYTMNMNGSIASVKERFDNEYFPMENYIHLKVNETSHTEFINFITTVNQN